MQIEDALKVFETYNVWLVMIGIAVLATAVLPRLLAASPFSMPMALLLLGYVVVALPFGLEGPDVDVHGDYIEHITELGVIIALMGAGLKIDRPPNWKTWSGTWRLLGITMILTIAFSAVIGWWVVAFAPATAVLLGAVIAPTDPVLASEVEVGAPGHGPDHRMDDDVLSGKFREDELRFSLTSEAGLNDGLAFPFTNMALAMVIAGAHPAHWMETWLLIHVLYELGVAAVVGLGLGYLLARVILNLPAKTDLARAMTGLGALAATLLIYGVTEVVGGYGFIATFLGAVVIRNHCRDHHYHEALHILTEKSERVLTAGILIALGGAIAGGLLEPLTWPLVVGALLIVFVVRPLAGMVGLLGFKRAIWQERLAISFLGIRGIGSLYYLSYALNEEKFPQTEEIWALVALVVVISIFVHGATATPITKKLDELRKEMNQRKA